MSSSFSTYQVPSLSLKCKKISSNANLAMQITMLAEVTSDFQNLALGIMYEVHHLYFLVLAFGMMLSLFMYVFILALLKCSWNTWLLCCAFPVFQDSPSGLAFCYFHYLLSMVI